jgi:hypothetical protein
MKDTEEVILNIFKNHPNKELSSEFLASEIYTQEYIQIEELIKSPDKTNMHDGKRRKFQLHRKILYYLNKLVESDIIKVAKIVDKGEKYFILKAEEGETIIEKGYKKIIITKPIVTSTQIDQYETKGVMKKYEEDTWITRFNSILLECSKTTDHDRIHTIMKDCFSNINDAIALNEFENVLNAMNSTQAKEFLERIIRDTDNFDRTVSIIINISQVSSNIYDFIRYFADANPKKVNIVFNMSGKDIQKSSKIIEHIIQEFSRTKTKINIHNIDTGKAPFFKGRAGIYNFDEDDWEIYQKRSKGKTIGVSCSQSQIAININRFFEAYHTDTEFRQAVINAAKTLLVANTIQRRKSNEYFRNINSMNSPNQADFYKFSRNYIRFWNYDWHKDIQENNNLFELIKSTKELVDNFCHSEETIFMSCGIPIRFRIAFSSAFRNFDSRFMGERDYRKATVKKVEDFYTGEIKAFINARERMFEIFDGGDRLRIFRTNDFASIDIIHEFSILLNAYKIPLFTYDFSGLKGTVKLTNFMTS